MTRKDLHAGMRVCLKNGARYADKTPIPARFFENTCTVLSVGRRTAFLLPMMRHVPFCCLKKDGEA